MMTPVEESWLNLAKDYHSVSVDYQERAVEETIKGNLELAEAYRLIARDMQRVSTRFNSLAFKLPTPNYEELKTSPPITYPESNIR